MADRGRLPSSFRDPSGHVFSRDGTIYRQINRSYRSEFEHLMESGLYADLVGRGLLIPHRATHGDFAQTDSTYLVIEPEPVPFVSYPYEWCFSQLKDAALLTLDVQRVAMAQGMSLKDASAYNVQFIRGKPVLIDTLSFEKYTAGEPWVAYRQFCHHFLSPLALMAYRDVRLSQLLRTFLDGVPLDLSSRLLPWRTRLRFGLLLHVHIHARAQKRYAGRVVATRRRMPQAGVLGLIEGLRSTIQGLRWNTPQTEWRDYYDATNYSAEATRHKVEIVSGFVDKAKPESAWDLGANTGNFSRITAEKGAFTVGFDSDPVAIERLYLACRDARETRILPLWLDLSNPSPALGWESKERMSFLERGPVDLVMALAIIHHLAISNNVPLVRLAELFSRTCKSLIIEFVPKEDSQVERLLATRKDIFTDYAEPSFEKAFATYFWIEEAVRVHDSARTVYYMRRKP